MRAALLPRGTEDQASETGADGIFGGPICLFKRLITPESPLTGPLLGGVVYVIDADIPVRLSCLRGTVLGLTESCSSGTLGLKACRFSAL